jgi:peptidoglycan hydrolase CwlO-like protein
MKTFLLLICISALSLSTIRSDDACCESKAATIQAKLQDIDLNCLLTKYEEVQTAKARAEVQLVLLDAEGEGHDTEIKKLQKRISTLAVHATRVRQELEEMTKEIKKQETVAAK